MTIRRILGFLPPIFLLLGCGLHQEQAMKVRFVNGCVIDVEGAESIEGKGDDSFTITEDCELKFNEQNK